VTVLQHKNKENSESVLVVWKSLFDKCQDFSKDEGIVLQPM
jgi:hypothetical protein